MTSSLATRSSPAPIETDPDQSQVGLAGGCVTTLQAQCSTLNVAKVMMAEVQGIFCTKQHLASGGKS